MSSRKTLKDFFKGNNIGNKSEVSNKLYYNITDANEDGRVARSDDDDLGTFLDDDGIPRKLISDNEGFLGNYLRFIVNQSNNMYYPAGNNNIIVGKYNRGNKVITEDSASSFSETLNTSKKTFIKTADTEGTNTSDSLGKNYLDTISLNQLDSNNLQSILDKAGSDPDKSGNNLFKDISGSDLNAYNNINSNERSDNKVLGLVEDYIINNNRFGNVGEDLNPFMKDNNPDNLEDLDYKINDKFGYSDESILVNIDQLKSLGEELLKKASGFSEQDVNIDNLNLASDIETNNLIGYGEKLMGIINNPVNSFQKVSGDNYRAKSTSIYPKDENGNTIRQGKGNFINQNSDSFGTKFNSEINFYKKNKKIVLIQARLASLAIYAIYNNLYQDIIKSLSQHNDTEDLKKESAIAIESGNFQNLYGKAKALPNLQLEALREKYITKTIYPYEDCVVRGMDICLSAAALDESATNPVFEQSPGYWLSVCSSVIKRFEYSINNITEFISKDDDANLRELMFSFTDNAALRFFNAMAVVGDVSLRSTAGKPVDSDLSLSENSSFYDVDALEDNPSTRFSKSKLKNGKRINQLSYAQSTVPSAYLFPLNSLRASIKMENGPRHPNLMRAHFGSDLVENTYLSINNDGSGGRIPNTVVKELEDRLDAEYVPFYIQDLRTNEIISFHAFLSSLTDQINPNFNSQGGYGRMDDVHIYNNTKRSITCGFTLMATSQEDFDNMWYKINKITTLLYPQWTQGSQVTRGESTFIQPFSQVIGASPIVRLRIGDVIKSNYSKFNLGRVFGIGNKGTKINNKGVIGKVASFGEGIQEGIVNAIAAIFGSPMQFENTTSMQIKKSEDGYSQTHIQAAAAGLSTLLVNGFVNPLALNPVMNQIKDPRGGSLEFFSQNMPGIHAGYMPNTSILFLKSNVSNGYLYETGEKIRFNRAITVLVIEKFAEASKDKYGKTIQRTKYKCKIIDPSILSNSGDYFNKHVYCYHEDLYPLPNSVFTNTALLPGLLTVGASTDGGSLLGGLGKELAAQALLSSSAAYGPLGNALSSVSNIYAQLLESHENKFLNSMNNPFTKAFESTMGRGLAGKLGGITFDWLDNSFSWETDYNSRAPMGCKITFNLDVIHDIPPGLDYAGYNRAPLYNVGKIMKDISGDVYNDGGFNSEAYFNKTRTIKKG